MEDKPKSYPHMVWYLVEELNLGGQDLLVSEGCGDGDVNGTWINGGIESNNSQFVVTTTPKVEFLEGCSCSCCCSWIGAKADL